MESTCGSSRQAYHHRRACTTLFYTLLLSSPGHMTSPSWAKAECEVIGATSFQVQNDTGVGFLRAAANCTDGGSLEVGWTGTITLDSPIVIASGMFLSVTGEDTLAEVHGSFQTRMFDVSQGGGLTLTRLKLSGGTETSGGAIRSDSATLTLDSCIFQGNEATDGDGGAVWAHGGNVTIVGGEFTSNNASGYGGAVAATGAVDSLVVQGGSVFEGNTALIGGALYCRGVEAESSSATSCSLSDTIFTSNNATSETNEDPRGYDFSAGVDGGGAVVFLFASANLTNSVFGGNYAQHSGGALLGGNGTHITVNGCSFESNTAEVFGGAIAAASMTLGGATQLAGNTALYSGGAVLGWDSNGTITFNNVSCTQNAATSNGGCFYGTGRGIVNNGTVMRDNDAKSGGCVYVYEDSEFVITGGEFTCRASKMAGFVRAEKGASLKITGGLVANNVAKRGGAISFSGEEGSLVIEGGTFVNNTALILGGVIAAGSISVEITGGTFSNNTATLFGGSVFLDEVGNFTCDGATFIGNSAGDQGGGIYARLVSFMNFRCDLIGNLSPQGAALYLASVEQATFENHVVADNVAYSGSVVYITSSSVIAHEVTFKSGGGLQEDSSNGAIQSDTNSALALEGCVFDGWLGDIVIYHRNAKPDSLILDSCDFRESSPITVVSSPNSEAKIRNTVVGDYTFANIGRLNGSMAFVDHALGCDSPDICGPGDCVASTLGVLCECLDDDTCLHGGGGLSLDVKTPPPSETYDPKTVSFELVVSSARNETAYAIWNMTFDAEELNLDVAPSSGILPPGDNVTVVVTGTPAMQDMGGNMTSSFSLASVSGASLSFNAALKQEVTSTFYLCSPYEYAEPLPNKRNGVTCKQCTSLDGGVGVDCTNPGATRASLPIRQGYWRSSPECSVVHECFHSGACMGATQVLDADGYCENGYRGPYCAVCSEGYGRGVSNTCHSCNNTNIRLLTWVGVVVAALVVLLLVVIAVVFLVGGLDAIDTVRKAVTQNVSMVSKKFQIWVSSYTIWQERDCPQTWAREDKSNATITPASDFTWESQHCAGERDDGHNSRKSPPTRFASDGAWMCCTQPFSLDVGVGTNACRSDSSARQASTAAMPQNNISRQPTVNSVTRGGGRVKEREGLRTNNEGQSNCCNVGVNINAWASRLLLEKFKILVVVWQILSSFSDITGVEFPASYSTFLSWINVVNLDIGHIFSASCVLPSMNFYGRLLVTTLTPFVLVAGLVLTYHIAKRRAGIGSSGVTRRRAAWSRHVAAGLLLTFLVFTSASTLVFRTFGCDDEIGDAKSYLRADYSISCKSDLHTFFKGYAMLMILVYPIGIPTLYAAILWRKRDLLNPRIYNVTMPKPDGTNGTATRADSVERTGVISRFLRTESKRQTKTAVSPQELQGFKERVRARKEHPELAPSMFLWKDFGPGLFYYEIIECGRRMLLTGVLIFIAPNSTVQVAAACLFAFACVVGFELLRPHADPVDVWLYRLGCVVIFLSYFLALLVKVDAMGEDGRSAFAGLLIAINVTLFLAVFVACWFTAKKTVDAVQKTADNYRDKNGIITKGVLIQAAEQDTTNTSGSCQMDAL